jgi:hypothetical protein
LCLHDAGTLWRRSGPTDPGRSILDEADKPGATLDCRSQTGHPLSSSRGAAFVRPAPVLAVPSGWRGISGETSSALLSRTRCLRRSSLGH